VGLLNALVAYGNLTSTRDFTLKYSTKRGGGEFFALFSVLYILRKFMENKLTIVKSNDMYAPHNDVSVNDGPHIRRWSHKIIIQCDSFGTRPKKMRISQRLFIRF